MNHIYDVFPKQKREKLSARARNYARNKGITLDEAIRIVQRNIKHYGDIPLNQIKRKIRVKCLKERNEEFHGQSDAVVESALTTILNRRKTMKYLRNNRPYQRLTTRIHSAKAKGDLALERKLRAERTRYLVTRGNGCSSRA